MEQAESCCGSGKRFYVEDFSELIWSHDIGWIKTGRHKKHGDIAAKNIRADIRERELEIISKLKPHDNHVRIYGLLYKDKSKIAPIGYVMERMHASLDKAIFPQDDGVTRDYSFKESIQIATKICDGIQWLHQAQIIHRDIKPHNVLVSEDLHEVKLCDYGVSAFYRQEQSLTAGQGTLAYMAPELIKDAGRAKYTESCDVFSAAVTIYELVMKSKVYYKETGQRAFTNAEVPTFPEDKPVCKYIKQITETGWSKDPKQRPSISLVRARLQRAASCGYICNNSCERFYKRYFPIFLYGSDSVTIKTETLQWEQGLLSAKIIWDYRQRKQELEVIEMLKPHDNLVHIHGLLYQDESEIDPIGYVMERMYTSLDKVIFPQGSDSMQDYSHDQSIQIARKICNGIEWLHQAQVVHRDIKPSSVLISQDLKQVKLCGYGVSALYRDGEYLTAGQGTTIYMAPEVRESVETAGYTTSCDVYSAAVTIYELVRKIRVYYEEIGNDALAMSLSGHIPTFPENETVCKVFKELVEKGWSKDPKQRPSISLFRTRLLRVASCGYICNNSCERFKEHYFPSLLHFSHSVAIRTETGQWEQGSLAAKIIWDNRQRKQELEMIEMLKPHPNLVHIYGLLYQNKSENDPIGYVMERMYTSLDKVIFSPLNERIMPEYTLIFSPLNGRIMPEYTYKQSLQIAVKICDGIACLHQTGIIHGNIKPSNILVSQDLEQVKLCVNGVSCSFEESLIVADRQGTLLYMAPEIRKRKENNERIKYWKHMESCDVYSAAVTIYELMTKRRASCGNNAWAMFLGEIPQFSENSSVCKVIKELIEKGWSEDRLRRPSVSDVRVRLLCAYLGNTCYGPIDHDGICSCESTLLQMDSGERAFDSSPTMMYEKFCKDKENLLTILSIPPPLLLLPAVTSLLRALIPPLPLSLMPGNVSVYLQQLMRDEETLLAQALESIDDRNSGPFYGYFNEDGYRTRIEAALELLRTRITAHGRLL